MLKTTLQPRSLALCAAITVLGVLGGCGPDGGGDGHGDEHGDHEEEGGHDEHEGEEEGGVHLTAEQIEGAGIRTQTARAGEIEVTLRLDAVVAENADTQAHVNPRAAGLIRVVHKQLGETVEKGDLLCEIDSVEMGQAVSEFQTSRAMAEAARGLLTKETELFRDRITTRTKVLDGGIALARRIRDREKDLEGQGLSTLRPLLEAETALQQAELQKEQALTELTADRDSRLLQLEAASTTADIALRTSTDRLRILGIDPKSVPAHGEDASKSLGLYEVRASRAGVIIARDATLDEFVSPDTALFEIHDPSVAWIVASVYERDLRRLQRGQVAHVRVNALPGATFDGHIGFIAFDVSSETRTTRVRVELENHPVEEWAEPFPLRPGMFGSMEIVTETRKVGIVLPELAIVHEGPKSYVFVGMGDGKFERREVEVGVHGGADVEILSGVEAGENVAISGTFVLKSAARAGELGGGHSH